MQQKVMHMLKNLLAADGHHRILMLFLVTIVSEVSHYCLGHHSKCCANEEKKEGLVPKCYNTASKPQQVNTYRKEHVGKQCKTISSSK